MQATLTKAGRTIPLAYSFTVAVPDTFGEAGGSSTPPAPNRATTRASTRRPDLRPPTVTVTAQAPPARARAICCSAPYSGPGQYGPMILDENGAMVWFKPLLPAGTRAADLRVQS